MPVPPTLPPIATASLSVVLLAHDAAGHIEALVGEWDRFLDERPSKGELILVDDGSTDDTAARAEALASRLPQLRVLRHDRAQGEGAALKTGLEAASRPLVFYTLCRPEYRPADLARLLDRPGQEGEGKAIDQVHLLSGYRAGRKMPWPLRLVGLTCRLFCLVVLAWFPGPLPGWLGWRRHLGWVLARLLFGVRYHDIACPFRLLRREVLARIPIQSRGPFAHVELLAKANFVTCVLGEEMPLDVTPPPYLGDLKQWLRDARRVFNHPDFGPAVSASGAGHP
jgi:glycosyltransferase involved in cell wall biosynthesis